MKYYFGAYYLIKLKKLNFGSFKGSKIYTCSTCINNSYYDSWSIAWDENEKNSIPQPKSDFNVNENLLQKIHQWTDQKLKENKIDWVCSFADLQTLNEYKTTFFPKSECENLSIYFPESERTEILKLFDPEKTKLAEVGFSKNLKKEIEENTFEQTLGYDIIGIEKSSVFHSFHCHNLANELTEKFGIEINEFGLINENDKWKGLLEFMNNEKNGCTPVPWFYVKVKRVIELV